MTNQPPPPPQFAYRTANSLVLSVGAPVYQPLENFQDPGGNVKIFQYSKDGSRFGWVSPESVKIVDAETIELIKEIPKSNVVEIGFSPKGNYISTWERPVRLQDGSVHKNLVIWKVETGEELISFTQKSQNNWNVQWTEDETYFCRMVTNNIHFYDSKNIENDIHSKLFLEGINNFSLSPGKNPSIAVVTPEKNTAPAIVRIYSITNFKSPLAQKTFFKMDKVVMLWNNLGTSLLVLTQTDVDKTNKSYYGGETNLYFLSVSKNNECIVKLDKEGPIHDVKWNPNSKEFIVIYGYMPFAKATLFNHRADPIRDFGANPRNTAIFNPQGKLVLIAGFGTLNGTVDIWDCETFKKITTLEAPNSTECNWSPDGRYILTATLSPRLRVDNCYKIWHYTGIITDSKNFQELLQVQWRPANPNLYPMRSLSPPPKIAQKSDDIISKPTPKRVGAYRPPHARARGASNDMLKDADESNGSYSSAKSGPTLTTAKPIGSSETLSKTAQTNKKKREAAKRRKEEAAAAAAATAANLENNETENSNNVNGNNIKSNNINSNKKKNEKTNGNNNNIVTDNNHNNKSDDSSKLSSVSRKQCVNSNSNVNSSSPLSETDKKIRNINKKLRQIAELKERQKKR